MEDDLEILKVQYLSNQLLDLPQLINLILGDQTKIENCLKGRQPTMEDDLTNLKYITTTTYWIFLNVIQDD
jgi:hypothetical protein